MTAIFAYVEDGIAFVASDTCRMAIGIPLPATKIHAWSDNVLIAQAGEARFLTKALVELRSHAGALGDSDNHFINNFNAIRERYWLEAVGYYEEKRLPAPSGTLLVASAVPSQITIVDFETGATELASTNIAAAGTDPNGYNVLAQTHMHELRQTGEPLELDRWAMLCLNDAIQANAHLVNWPGDVLIARPSGVGGRMLIQRRINSAGDNAHSIFAVI